MLTHLVCAMLACSLGFVGGGCMASAKFQQLQRPYFRVADVARRIVGTLPLPHHIRYAEVMVAGKDMVDLWRALKDLDQAEQEPLLPACPPSALAAIC